MFTASTIATSLGAMLMAGTLPTGDAATGHEPGQSRGARDKIEKLCARLDCTPDQKQKLAAIGNDLREDVRAARKDVKGINSAIAAEYRKDSPNQRAMKRQYNRIERKREATNKRRHQALMDAHGVLTPSQRAVIADRIERHGPGGAFKARRHKPGKKAKKDRKNPRGNKARKATRRKHAKRAKGADKNEHPRPNPQLTTR